MPQGEIQMWDRTRGKIRDDEGGSVLDFTTADLLNPSEGEGLQQGDTVAFDFDEEQDRHAVAVQKA